MMELTFALATAAMLGILLALGVIIDIERQRRREFAALMEYLAPCLAQFEQSMHALAATLPSATESMALLADTMLKIGGRVEDCTEQNFGPSPNSVRVVTFKGDG